MVGEPVGVVDEHAIVEEMVPEDAAGLLAHPLEHLEPSFPEVKTELFK